MKWPALRRGAEGTTMTDRISRMVFARAAGAICGMVETDIPESSGDKPVIAASMFGSTTPCVNARMAALSAEGYEVLVFHATGTGGKTMEGLIREGFVDAVLDITTTEWADTVCGGVFDIPLRGVSILDGDGRPFCDREADRAMFDAIKAHLREGIEIFEMDRNINDSEFSAETVEMMLALIEEGKDR